MNDLKTLSLHMFEDDELRVRVPPHIPTCTCTDFSFSPLVQYTYLPYTVGLVLVVQQNNYVTVFLRMLRLIELTFYGEKTVDWGQLGSKGIAPPKETVITQ